MKRKAISFLILIFALSRISSNEHKFNKIFLWRNVDGMELNIRDTILYIPKEIPETENNMAVIICPGGSYHHLGMKHEGFCTANKMLDKGIIGIVLRYRVSYNGHHHPAMLEDLQMAIKYVRENAEVLHVDKNKVGAIGFSAGGHLVLMAGAFGDNQNELEKIGLRTKESLRPNFIMPIYPVVSMQDDIAHKRSRKSLLGRHPSEEMKQKYSMEMQIPNDMVPIFLLACKDDSVVLFENSVRLNDMLNEKNISHEFHFYEKGDHGFGMADDEMMKRTSWDTALFTWLEQFM